MKQRTRIKDRRRKSSSEFDIIGTEKTLGTLLRDDQGNFLVCNERKKGTLSMIPISKKEAQQWVLCCQVGMRAYCAFGLKYIDSDFLERIEREPEEGEVAA